MKGDGRFYFACAVMLLALPGCTQGISAAMPLEDSYAMAVPNDDPSPGERDYREADFGLDDPGVTVITADKGGSIPSYERKFFGAGNNNTRWVVDGYCNSACTMVLGTGRVCATPRAQFNFHGGYYNYFGFWKVITPQWTYQMYQRYPDDVKSWVDAHHAMDQITLTMMQQPEVATYVLSCRPRSYQGRCGKASR